MPPPSPSVVGAPLAAPATFNRTTIVAIHRRVPRSVPAGSSPRFYLDAQTRAKLNPVPPPIRIPREILNALLQHARTNSPKESCGLLAGHNSGITNFYPTENSSPTPKTNYEINPMDLFRILREIRERNLDLKAIYHSHPTTEPTPSPTDITRAYYPQAAYIIVSPQSATPIRAYQIRDNKVTEISIESR